MRFKDREEAARLLAARLDRFRGQAPLVLGIPRGGVVVASLVAETIGGDLDAILVQKLYGARDPSRAIGAIDEDGNAYIAVDEAADTASASGAGPEAMQAELQRRRMLYCGWRDRLDIRGRLTIVVDDGVATGVSMVAAIRAVRAHRPRRVVAAAPVAAPLALRAVTAHADEVVCLHAPRAFQSVAAFFDRFDPVGDEGVVRLLRRNGPPGVAV